MRSKKGAKTRVVRRKRRLGTLRGGGGIEGEDSLGGEKSFWPGVARTEEARGTWS